jgi:hypothetical protein
MERKHFNEDNKLVNRRMANTLMSGRLYVDHLQTDLTALFGRNSSALKKVQEAIQNEKEGTFAYRVMDRIRNYALHRSFPLKYVACGSHWEGDPPTHARHTISPILDVDQIAMDQRFDRDVLKELQSFEGEINLTQLLRQHMEAIGRIHLTVREVMAHSVAKWDAIILGMSQRAKDFFKPDEMFSVVKLTEEKECLDEEFIIDDIVHFRVELAIQNSFCLQNISRHYVSGIIEAEATK